MSRITESFRSFSNVAMEDLRSAPPIAKVGFVGALALGGFHLLGAETLYANIGTRVLEDTNGWSSALDTGAALAATSLALETASTVVVSNAVKSFPNTVNHFYERIWAQPEDLITPKDETTDIADKSVVHEPSKKDIALNILGLGSPGYILEEYIKEPRKTVRENIKTGMKAAGALAVANFSIGVAAATVAKNAHHIGETGTKIIYGVGPHELGGLIPSAGVLPVLETPLFWMSLFATNQVLKHRRINKMRQVTSQTMNDGLLQPNTLPQEGSI